MQFEWLHDLNHRQEACFALASSSRMLEIWINSCDGDGDDVSVYPYVHLPQEKVFNHLVYVWQGCVGSTSLKCYLSSTIAQWHLWPTYIT
jgi:hypothetical protein